LENIKTKVQLVKARSGSTEAMEELVTSHKTLVSSVARRYFILGGETDDLIQEGMIGLYEAIQTYKFEAGASFKTYAKLLVERKVQTAVKSANRQKHKMLNQFIPINNQGLIVTNSGDSGFDEDNDNELGIYVESTLPGPDEDVINKETKAFIEKQIEEKLTNKEKQILALFIAGKSYSQIAKELDTSKKNVDNVLYSIRKKLAFLKQN
jgi:RNA polymerase sporulation-specific sigma factor